MANKISNLNLIQEGKGIKRTSIGRGALKLSSMNKSKKRSFKKYKGQG